MRNNLIAAIDVGSQAVRMKIGQVNKVGAFKELDSFRRVLPLGHNTFLYQRVDFDVVDMLCDVLDNFKSIMNEYGIKNYSALATSAIREAKNKNYIIDQIHIKTGLNVIPIDNTEEQYLTSKAIRLNLSNFDKLTHEGVIIVVIGAGSIQLTTYKNGALTTSQNLKMGSLRIREILSSLQPTSLKYKEVLEEYINVNFEDIKGINDADLYKHLVVVGSESKLISSLVGCENGIMTSKKMEKLYDTISELSQSEVIDKYRVDPNRARTLYPTLLLLKKFISIVETDEIIVPNISLVDGIVRDLYETMYSKNLDDNIIEDVITNANVLAKSYGYNEVHSKYIEEIAIMIFKKMAKVHGLKSELLHLRVAAILCDIGKSISLNDYTQHSYQLIRMLELFGMSKENMEMVALIAKYNGMTAPSDAADFGTLPSSKRIIVAKLIAILRIADSLDRAHKQKIKIKSIKLKDKLLQIKCISKEDTTLEKWCFERRAAYFKEVFGIHTKLSIKKEL